MPRGSRVSGIRQRGGTTDNSSCGWSRKHPSRHTPNGADRQLAGSRFVGDAGVALFWLLARQAEEGGRKDELACPARGQTNFGGQRMTRPQRRPASLRAFPEPGLVMRWPGVAAPLAFIACLGGFVQRCRTERRSGSARSRSLRSGVELSCAKAGESGVLGPAKCRGLARWLATP